MFVGVSWVGITPRGRGTAFGTRARPGRPRPWSRTTTSHSREKRLLNVCCCLAAARANLVLAVVGQPLLQRRAVPSTHPAKLLTPLVKNRLPGRRNPCVEADRHRAVEGSVLPSRDKHFRVRCFGQPSALEVLAAGPDDKRASASLDDWRPPRKCLPFGKSILAFRSDGPSGAGSGCGRRLVAVSVLEAVAALVAVPLVLADAGPQRT